MFSKIKLSCLLFLASMPLHAAPKSLATFAPEKPESGQTIKVVYNSTHPKAKLPGAKSATLEALIMRRDRQPLLKEIPLDMKGASWSASFKLDEAEALMVLYRFTADEKVDDNGQNVWNAMVHERGKPVRGALRQMALLLRGGGWNDFAMKKDVEAAKKSLDGELKLYPDNWEAQTVIWSISLRENPGEEIRNRIAEEAEELLAANAGNETAAAALIPWFERIEKKERADAVRSEYINANPRGKVAEALWRAELGKEKDHFKRMGLIDGLLNQFEIAESERERLRDMYISACIQSGQFEIATHHIEAANIPDPMQINALASKMLEDGAEIERALELLRRAADFANAPDPERKPSWMNERQWARTREKQRAQVLHSLGKGLLKGERAGEAVMYMEEAYQISAGDDEKTTESYLEALGKSGRGPEVMEIAKTAIAKGKASEKIVTHFRTAYVAVHGSEDGFEKELKAAEESAAIALRKKLENERLDLPAPDFSLKDLSGKQVSLSALKGKVVVVDFWATWCGPCKASFPALQKVYDAWKSDDRVRILALNTWENEKGDKKEEIIRKFMEGNSYTFPVLYDEKTVDAYGVTGIPTKFVIGPDGRIRFKSVGFDGAEQMEKELTMQLRMLLGE